MNNESKSLVTVKEKSLSKNIKNQAPRIYDGAVRISKTIGSFALTVGGTGLLFSGILPLQIVGGILTIAQANRFGQNFAYQVEPSLMFKSYWLPGGKRGIGQDTRISLASKMKGYTASEKGGMMVLQTLVGFSRWKENLKNSPFELDENGRKIYSKKLCTQTHGINIKALKSIEKLGYIKIDSINGEKYDSTDKISRKVPSKKKSYLISEKIAFRNWQDVKKIFKAGISGDKETLASMKKDMYKIEFRLTDKEINFEELYSKCAKTNEITDKDEKAALKRLGIVFDNERGILATKHIDIGKDKFGRDILKYGKDYSFKKRVNPDFIKSDDRRAELMERLDARESLKENQITKEMGENKSNEKIVKEKEEEK